MVWSGGYEPLLRIILNFAWMAQYRYLQKWKRKIITLMSLAKAMIFCINLKSAESQYDVFLQQRAYFFVIHVVGLIQTSVSKIQHKYNIPK